MTATVPSVSVEETQWEGLSGWRITTAYGEAWLARQGAQLLRYQPYGQPPVLWLSDAATYLPGQPVRGGIPICWPWFGELARNPEAVRRMTDPAGKHPAHGLARSRDWTLDAAEKSHGDVFLRLSLLVEQGLPGWPHAARLSVEYRFGERLAIELRTDNLSDHRLTISQAMHSYFAVGDSRQVRIEGLNGLRYVDTLDDWTVHKQQGLLSIEGEIDRIYLGIEQPLTIVDPVYQRRIRVHSEGSRSAVVWNPGTVKTQRLSQMKPDAWEQMLCIETARVLEDAMVIEPGGSEAISVEITIV